MSTAEPGADRNTWKTRLAAVERELASQPVESLGDLLRVGEQVLTAALSDVGAGSHPEDRDAEEAEIAARLARAREFVAAARTAWSSATTMYSRRQPIGTFATHREQPPCRATG